MATRVESSIFKINGSGENINWYSYDNFPLRVALISATPNPESVIVANYTTCIKGEMVIPDQLIGDYDDEFEWIVKGGHTPALESVHITFAITGASVVLLKQISRHRIGNSLGVMTQRANAEEYLGRIYTNSHFVIPPSFKGDVLLKYYDLMQKSEEFYNFAIENGAQQDEARYGIPQGSMTMWQGTYAYKTLLDNICSTRLCHIMQGEMVVLARLIRDAVMDWNLTLGRHLKPVCLRYGQCNRNENNPTDEFPKGACKLTQDGLIPVRKRDDTYNLTQYSKDVDDDSNNR